VTFATWLNIYPSHSTSQDVCNYQEATSSPADVEAKCAFSILASRAATPPVAKRSLIVQKSMRKGLYFSLDVFPQ